MAAIVSIMLLSMVAGLIQVPTAKADSGNLDPINAFYADTNGAASSYATVNYGVTHNGSPSIQMGADYVRGTREVDGAWSSVQPGDHIVFSAWTKSDPYHSAWNPYSGNEVGFDFYVSTNLGYGIATVDSAGHQAGHPQDAEVVSNYSSLTSSGPVYISWGNDWTQIIWSFTIPYTYYTWVTIAPQGSSLPYAPYVCDYVQINSIVPWFTGRDTTAPVYAYFSDTSLVDYGQNPSAPTPSPTPTGTIVTDTIGTTDNTGDGNNGYLAGSAITASQTGTLSTVGINIATPFGNIEAAIYNTYSGGSFSGLLGQSISNATKTGWNDLVIPGNINIVAGTTYYVVWTSDSLPYRYYSSSGTTYLAAMSYGAFPSTTNTLYSIAATENMRIKYYSLTAPTGSPTPTPTTTPTTLTPTPTPTPIRPGDFNQFLITQAPFNINFNTGDSFAVQCLNPASTIIFTITSGTLNGTGSVNASNVGGIFDILPITSGTLLITSSGAPVSIYIDGLYHNNVPFNFYPGKDTVVTWSYGGQIIVNNNGAQYYFRSDTYHTLDVTGNGFDADYTNTAQSINEIYSGAGDVTYGFQVYLFSSPTKTTELTSGPSATMLASGNYSGTATSIINIPNTPVVLGYQAIEINVLEKFNGGAWVTVANFISPVLITNSIEASTWQFILQINQTQYGGSTYSNFLFGNSQYRSGVNNILFSKPLQSDVAMWRLSRGDYIGFLLGEYLDEMGIGFYGLCLFLVGSTLYFRYKHFGTIAFFFAVFGGPGGIIWIFLPAWGAAVASAIIIIGLAFVVWRVIR